MPFDKSYFRTFSLAVLLTYGLGSSVAGVYHLINRPVVAVTPNVRLKHFDFQNSTLQTLTLDAIKSPVVAAHTGLAPKANYKSIGTFALAEKATPKRLIILKDVQDVPANAGVRTWITSWDARICQGQLSSLKQAKDLEAALDQSTMCGADCNTLAEMLRFAAEPLAATAAYSSGIKKIGVELAGSISPERELTCCNELASTRYALWQYHDIPLLARETELEIGHRHQQDAAYFMAVLFHSQAAGEIDQTPQQCILELDRLAKLYDSSQISGIGLDKRTEIDELRGSIKMQMGDFDGAASYFRIASNETNDPRVRSRNAMCVVDCIGRSHGRTAAAKEAGRMASQMNWSDTDLRTLAFDVIKGTLEQ